MQQSRFNLTFFTCYFTIDILVKGKKTKLVPKPKILNVAVKEKLGHWSEVKNAKC